MELKILNGDYVPDGAGGMCRLGGAEEVLARVLYRLTARRGSFPFLPELGSQLHRVLRERPTARQALAAQYVAQALEEENDVKVTAVEWLEQGSGGHVAVHLEWQGEPLSLTVELQGAGT